MAPAPRPPKKTFESLLAPLQNNKAQTRVPGPATRDIQRLASSVRSPEMTFNVEFNDGGSMDIYIIGGEKEPLWMPAFDNNPPGGGYLWECLDQIREGIEGRVTKQVEVRLTRPKANAQVEADAAKCFAMAIEEMRQQPHRQSVSVNVDVRKRATLLPG
jgi:hypothetical protein